MHLQVECRFLQTRLTFLKAGSIYYLCSAPFPALSGCCCCCLIAKSCLTFCDPMDCSMPGFFILHYLLEFAQTHAH